MTGKAQRGVVKCLGPFGPFWGCSEECECCFYLLLPWTAHASGRLLQPFKWKERCICYKSIISLMVNIFFCVSDNTFAFIHLFICSVLEWSVTCSRESKKHHRMLVPVAHCTLHPGEKKYSFVSIFHAILLDIYSSFPATIQKPNLRESLRFYFCFWCANKLL